MSNVVHLNAPEPMKSYSGSQLRLIRDTIAKDLNESEFDMFVQVCRRVGLDPFRKQIYANVYNKEKADKRTIVFITSVDGFRAIAARNGDYRPDEEEPEITYDESLKGKDNPKGIEKAVVTVWKRDKSNDWHKIKGVARWEEFAPLIDFEWVDGGDKWPSGAPKKTKKILEAPVLDDGAKFWRKMPALMLAKCAEVQALRRGWPEDLSGVYAPEEMEQADLEDKTASEIVEHEEEERRLKLIGGANKIHLVMNPGDPIEGVPIGQVADRCIEYIRGADHVLELEKWRERNRIGLQEFWARAGNDALEVKKALEAKIEKLKAENEA